MSYTSVVELILPWILPFLIRITYAEPQIQRLETALREYESEKWRIVSGKVGNGFTALACKEKAEAMAVSEE